MTTFEGTLPDDEDWDDDEEEDFFLTGEICPSCGTVIPLQLFNHLIEEPGKEPVRVRKCPQCEKQLPNTPYWVTREPT